tara:strand:+ start:461 stop:1126 length:666 start_codon:yes stop_codon:yes gene_type:complete
MVRNYLIIGSNSELAKEFIKLNSINRNQIFTISRNSRESDIDIDGYKENFDEIFNYVKNIPNCYILFFNGFLAENRPLQYPTNEEVISTYKINFQIPLFLTVKLSQLENVKKYIYISSVAAIRPRFKNYIYGNAKKMLEQSIQTLDLKSFLILRFGKINTLMSVSHKNIILTLNKEEAANLILKNIEKEGVLHANYGLKIVSIILRILPIKFINYIEKSLN